MASPTSKRESGGKNVEETDQAESLETKGSLQSSLDEIRSSLERLSRSVNELDSKLRSTGDVLKWVLEALSRRSEEKELMYLKSIEASNELLSSFMRFVNSRIKPLAEGASSSERGKASGKETLGRDSTVPQSRKSDEYLVKPSMVKRLQEEDGKEKDKRSR
jgi:hypothetical protein